MKNTFSYKIREKENGKYILGHFLKAGMRILRVLNIGVSAPFIRIPDGSEGLLQKNQPNKRKAVFRSQI